MSADKYPSGVLSPRFSFEGNKSTLKIVREYADEEDYSLVLERDFEIDPDPSKMLAKVEGIITDAVKDGLISAGEEAVLVRQTRHTLAYLLTMRWSVSS